MSIIKFYFLDTFWLHFFHQFPNTFLMQIEVFLCSFWLLFLSKFSEPEIAKIFCYVSYVFVFEPHFWNYQLSFSNQVVNRPSFWIVTTKMIFRLVRCIWNQMIWGLFSSICSFVLSRNFLLSCKICVFVPSIKVLIDKVSLVTSDISRNLSANAFFPCNRNSVFRNCRK